MGRMSGTSRASRLRSRMVTRCASSRPWRAADGAGGAPPHAGAHPHARIYATREFMTPTGSVKDRPARALIEDLEERGVLGPDSIILEPTSGNTGIALAMIARRKGYRIALVMPDNVTAARG